MGQGQDKQVTLSEDGLNAVAAVLGARHDGAVGELGTLGLARGAAREEDGAESLGGNGNGGEGGLGGGLGGDERGAPRLRDDGHLIGKCFVVDHGLHAEHHGHTVDRLLVQVGGHKNGGHAVGGAGQVGLDELKGVGAEDTHQASGGDATAVQHGAKSGYLSVQLGVGIGAAVVHDGYGIGVGSHGVSPHGSHVGVVDNLLKGLGVGIGTEDFRIHG